MIAPVQAFILKQLLLESDVITWKAIKAEKCDQLLVKAMTEIINQAADVQDPKYSVVHANDSNGFASSKEGSKPTEPAVNSAQDASESSQINETQVTTQSSLESDVFHSQLRWVPVEMYSFNRWAQAMFNFSIFHHRLQDIHYK